MNGLWKEVFSTGTHKDKNGTVKEFSANDIDNIVTKYKDRLKKSANDFAAVTIGHNNPLAFGWIKDLKREGEKLVAQFSDVVPAFEELVKQKMLKNTSISIDGNYDLKHVAFLGTVPPAIKGLADLDFSGANEWQYFDYAETESTQNKPQQKETNNNQVTGLSMKDLQVKLKEAIAKEFSEEVASKIDEFITKETKVGVQNSYSETENKKIEELTQQLQALQNTNKELKFSQFFDSKVIEGKLVPAQREAIKPIWDKLTKDTMDFSEGSDVYKAIDNFINSLPKMELNKEFAVSNDYSEQEKKENERLEKIAKNFNR